MRQRQSSSLPCLRCFVSSLLSWSHISAKAFGRLSLWRTSLVFHIHWAPLPVFHSAVAGKLCSRTKDSTPFFLTVLCAQQCFLLKSALKHGRSEGETAYSGNTGSCHSFSVGFIFPNLYSSFNTCPWSPGTSLFSLLGPCSIKISKTFLLKIQEQDLLSQLIFSPDKCQEKKNPSNFDLSPQNMPGRCMWWSVKDALLTKTPELTETTVLLSIYCGHISLSQNAK